jgi:hypothetical protein
MLFFMRFSFMSGMAFRIATSKKLWKKDRRAILPHEILGTPVAKYSFTYGANWISPSTPCVRFNFAQKRGVAIFAKACFGHPSPSKQQKLNATADAFGAPDVLRTCHFATTIVNSVLAS